MWLYLIGGILVVGSVIALLVIYFRHRRQLGEIRVQDMPIHQQVAKKHAIIDERLERKLRATWEKMGGFIEPLVEKLRGYWGSLIKRLHALDRHYRKQRLVQQSVSSSPEERVSQQAFIRRTLEECGGLLEQEDFSGVEKKCIEVITLDPRLYEAYILLGRAYHGQKDMANASQSFQHAVRLLEKMRGRHELLEVERLALVESYFLAGETLQESGEYRRALVFFVKAAKAEPNNPRYLDQAITTAIAAQDRYTATVYLDALKQINPENQKIAEWAQQLEELAKKR